MQRGRVHSHAPRPAQSRLQPFSPSLPALPASRYRRRKSGWLQPAGNTPSAVAYKAADVAAAGKAADTGSNFEGRHTNGTPVAFQGNGASSQEAILEENRQWQTTAFPSYLQSAKDDFCQNWDEALQDVERKQSLQRGRERPNAVTSSNPVWQAMRKEATRDAREEPLLSSFLYSSILSHDTFLECLAFVLANRLSDPTMLATEYYETFLTVFNENDEIVQAALDDIQAVRERDPACSSYSNALLFYKGYQAIQVHRIAHHLWNLGQRISALNLHSRVSQVFAIDIHPQARMGKGILLDHGTGVVIGQTAVVGNNVSILQNVTLGGTGKSDGDRHPKISDNVLIGAGATILGNITVGKGAMVASGSLVLKPVPSKTMVAGSPAREVGKVSGNPAMKMQHWLKTINADSDPFCQTIEEAVQSRDAQPPAAEASTSSGSHLQESQHTQHHSSPSAGPAEEFGKATQKVAVGVSSDAQQKQPREAVGAHVVAVRSDDKAKRLWPKGPEPEYYL